MSNPTGDALNAQEDTSWSICQKCGEYEHDCRCATATQEEQSQQPAPAAVQDAELKWLRAIHGGTLREVLTEYGWSSIPPAPSPAQEKPVAPPALLQKVVEFADRIITANGYGQAYDIAYELKEWASPTSSPSVTPEEKQ